MSNKIIHINCRYVYGIQTISIPENSKFLNFILVNDNSFDLYFIHPENYTYNNKTILFKFYTVKLGYDNIINNHIDYDILKSSAIQSHQNGYYIDNYIILYEEEKHISEIRDEKIMEVLK